VTGRLGAAAAGDRDPRAALTVGQLVRAAADSFHDADAIVLGEDRLSYAELDRRSRRLARGLLARGVTEGTRIGFVYGNSPGWVVTFAAISRIGAIAVPLSTFYRGPELARVLRHGDVAGLILVRSHLGHDYLETLADGLPGLAGVGSPELALAEAPFLRWVVSADAAPAWATWVHGPGWLTAGGVRRSMKPCWPRRRPPYPLMTWPSRSGRRGRARCPRAFPIPTRRCWRRPRSWRNVPPSPRARSTRP
jgi:hypothetical protein